MKITAALSVTLTIGWLLATAQLSASQTQTTFADSKPAPKGSEVVEKMLKSQRVVIVRDRAMGNLRLATHLATALRQQDTVVATATLDELVDPQRWRRITFSVLILPNAKRLPANAREPLLEFLRQGGKLIAFGAPIFGEPMFKVRQGTRGEIKWVTAQEMEVVRRQTKPQRWLFERLDKDEISRWQYHASHPDVDDKLSVEPVDDLTFTRHALRMGFNLKGWAIFIRQFDDSPFPLGHSLTCFWAKGAPQTKSLLVEWREADGTRWFAHVPLTTEWRLIVLSPKDFVFRADSPTRGKRGLAGDRFNPQNARVLVLGMEAPMAAGKQTIWVAGFGTAPDPFGDVATDFEPPTLETLSPAYKLFPMRNVTKLREQGQGPGELTVKQMPTDAVAPVPRWRGIGFTNGERIGRWQPLTMAHDGSVERGVLIWQMRYAYLPFPHAALLVFGSADEPFWLRHEKLVSSALKRVLTSWQQPVWLLEGGTDRFTAHPDELMRIGVVIVNSGSQSQRVSVRLLVEGKAGIVYERRESKSVDSYATKTLHFSVDPLPTGEYRVRVQLIYTGRIVDEIAHELAVIPHPKITEADKVTVKGGHFVVAGERRWFAFGVNFWPRYVVGKEPSDYRRHWLDPTNYDPELVEQDLEILRQMGMNCVSIQYTDPRQALPLRDFLRRCRRHGIKVNLFIAGAHPLGFQPELVRQLIEGADLANQPALFAYDIAWEPRWGNYNERRRHDAEWRAWLEEQYGSVESAERDWNFSLPRDEKGNPTVPKDEHLLNDGEWRVMAAAYRRFLDDFISRKYRKVVRFIRRLDPHHLIGARTGYGGGPFGAERAFPFDHTAGAKHLDFVSPEGWNLGWLGQADERQFARAAFITAYARWAGKGKPVFWAEFGLTLRHGAFSLDWYGDEERLKAQAQLYEAMYRLIQLSDADGAMGWWFPGGYRVDERSDFGVVNPDGTLRPAAEVAKRWSTILTQLPLEPALRPEPPVPIRIDRDENACGPIALWLKHGDEVAKLVQEGKRLVLVTDGTGKTSDDCPDVAIGNTPWAPGKPPKFLNGEINAVWISRDGKEWREAGKGQVVKLGSEVSQLFLRVELGNTGEVAWLPPNLCRDKERGIVVRIGVDGGKSVEVPILKRVEPFADVVVDGIVLPLPKGAQPVRLSVRLHWRNAPFGECWKFAVQR